ncbi:calcium-binding protein [Zavarzinia aquatilis]|uniref:Hemolysin n=1 Tax=Zavarzinia aquatilis TaxID=2211142 RepID=A0A317DXN8_9PROT|nr:calcium-binding protein [Zavarzinia aquatilis]PWR18616.1 hemolysin [Zavarzinia aquatilis]
MSSAITMVPVSGTMGDDYLYASWQADDISANGGDDYIFASPEVMAGDVYDGGVGIDTLGLSFYGATRGINIAVADTPTATTFLGATLTSIERLQVFATDYADRFTGGAWGDMFQGGGGNDIADGGGGNDFISGDEGRDQLRGGAGDDLIDGGADIDTLYGGFGRDLINGGDGDDKIYGEAGDDSLFGGAGKDTISGGDGNDYIWGEAGNDTIDGGAGDDLIVGGAGDDTLKGGSGADRIETSLLEGRDVINGGSGLDRVVIRDLAGTFTALASNLVNTLANGTTLQYVEAYELHGSAGVDKFTGHDRDDAMNGYAGNDTLKGEGGDDALDGGTGRDRLEGGAGDDVLSAAGGGADTLIGGTGVDLARLDRSNPAESRNYTMSFSADGKTITLSDGTTMTDIERLDITTSKGDDTLSAGNALSVRFDAGEGNNSLTGGSGGDTLMSGAGADTISGGAGDDYIVDQGGNNTIDAGTGNDRVSVTSKVSATTTIALGAGNDTAFLNDGTGSVRGTYTVDGGTGFDFVAINRSQATAAITFVLSANATLVNGAATLKNIEQVDIRTGSGNDSLTGGAAADRLDGGAGNDMLKGLAGDDMLVGGAGADTLHGDAGDDELWAGNGGPDGDADQLYGGDGNDRLHISAGDFADGGAGIDHLLLDLSDQTVAARFTLTTGRLTVGGSTTFEGIEALTFDGGSGADAVTTGNYADRLSGGDGNDTLKAGGGNDELRDGNGSDKLYGGAGDDMLIRTDEDGAGADVFDGQSGFDTLAFAIDSATGVTIDLENRALNDGLAKGMTISNIERIIGTDIADTIRGSAAAETFEGGYGSDILDGRAGDDVLRGGQGGDILTGGAGKDMFAYGDDVFDASGAAGAGDLITDFHRGEDKILIDREGFDLAADYALALVVGADPVATGSKAQFLFESDNGRLWFDADGAGGAGEAMLIATLQGVTTLSVSDFILA